MSASSMRNYSHHHHCTCYKNVICLFTVYYKPLSRFVCLYLTLYKICGSSFDDDNDEDVVGVKEE